MARATNEAFLAVRTEGLMLPPELLQRVADLDTELPGLTGTDYHLAEGERLNEVVNRTWNRLTGLWPRLSAELAAAGPDDALTGATRERWLLPLFQELGYGRLQRKAAVEIERKTYSISHSWHAIPIHLVGAGLDIDKRTPGQAGAARSSPHSIVQEFLNRSDDHLWGFVSNGLRLRILRDNISLTRQAFVEFDLSAIMDGELYADFRLLWLLCHQSRVEAERPESCCLEQWYDEAKQLGTRALDQLRDGVESAITALGSGFLSHKVNTVLHERLASGDLSTQDFYRQILRLVYRLIFLFVSEDRDLLLAPDGDAGAKRRYLEHYSTQRLRRIAGKLRGSRHDDLYESLKVVMDKLDQTGCPELGISPLGSLLWSPDAVADLTDTHIANRDLLGAVRALAFIKRGGTLRQIDYRNLGPEELGGVYESLLELHPEIHRQAAAFELNTAAGHERKTTGSYYTPDSLVQCLLDSALEPVMNDAESGKWGEEAAQALLTMKVCDPAVGSGHFLIAAAHRIARRVAAARTGDAEPSPADTRAALRDVIGRCLYGVDINPMSAELCRVNLWLEAMEPGKPLTFLDHHIRVGNALLGTTPELIAKGIPDDAFKPISGDDRALCTALKRKNQQQREAGQQDMLHLMVAEPMVEYKLLAAQSRKIDEAPDVDIKDIERKADQFRRFVVSPEYQNSQRVCDSWCAAFVWSKKAGSVDPITTNTLFRLESDADALSAIQACELERLAEQYQFFHWHLAFPEVFAKGGFDCVLGNPPWEKVQIEEIQFFASHNSPIANLKGLARKDAIRRLPETDHELAEIWQLAKQGNENLQKIIRNAGLYPLTGIGKFNSYALFAELYCRIRSELGRCGLIVPTGIATDDNTKFFFQYTIESNLLRALYDFQNRRGFFDDVHKQFKFCLLTIGYSSDEQKANFEFFCEDIADIADATKTFSLTANEIKAFNPNTQNCPIFRSARDAELTLQIYELNDVLLREENISDSLYQISVWRMINTADDADIFLDSNERSESSVPVVEAKTTH